MKLEQARVSSLPDFRSLYDRYEALGPGPQADLRRVRDVDAVADLPAYYRWLGARGPSIRLQRLAFLLPHVRHADQVWLGRALRRAGVSEMRMFQMLRSHPPRDLEQFRRLCQQAGPLPVDIQALGHGLWFWGRNAKRTVLRDYLVSDIEQTEDNPE